MQKSSYPSPHKIGTQIMLAYQLEWKMIQSHDYWSLSGTKNQRSKQRTGYQMIPPWLESCMKNLFKEKQWPHVSVKERIEMCNRKNWKWKWHFIVTADDFTLVIISEVVVVVNTYFVFHRKSYDLWKNGRNCRKLS